MDTLTRMRAFVAVVEAGGYSAAGRKVGRSKALLSKYVRELEDEVGALLLNRTTRKVALTPVGEIYYHRAGELIREIDTLRDVVGDQSGATGGTVRVTAPRSLADSAKGQALVDFAAAHPDIALELDLSDRFVDLLEEGFDVAIRIAILDDTGLIAKKLDSMSLRTVASPALIANGQSPERPEDMRNLPLIVDTNTRRPMQLRYQNEDGAPMLVPIGRARLTVNSPMLALRAACEGLGYAQVPDFVAEEALASGRLVEVLASYRSDEAAIYALYPHRRHVTRRVRLFLDFLADWFRGGGDRGRSPRRT